MNVTCICNSPQIPHVNRFNLHHKCLFMAGVNAELFFQGYGKAEALLLNISAQVSGIFSLQCITNILRQHLITQLRHATYRTIFLEHPSEGFELCLLSFCVFSL